MTSQPQHVTPGRELPSRNTSRRIRTANQPRSTGLELAKHQEALQHRFLAYTFPSRSPDPAHPAVLDRSDFVAAAPTFPGDPRIRLPPASPDRYDGQETKAFHLHPTNTAPAWRTTGCFTSTRRGNEFHRILYYRTRWCTNVASRPKLVIRGGGVRRETRPIPCAGHGDPARRFTYDIPP